MEMRCTILSLVLCALAAPPTAAAPGRHPKTTAADAADPVDAVDVDAAATRRPRKGAAPEARKPRVRDARNANARNANARNADTRNADTRNANTRNANTRNADTRNADTRNADTRNADTRNADARSPRKIESDDDTAPRRRTPHHRSAADMAAAAAADTAAAVAVGTPSERAPDARDAGHEVVVQVARPRQPPHRNVFYFFAGVAHIDSRVASGGLQLDPAGLASLAAMPGPMNGSVESDPSNIFAGTIGFAPAMLRGYVAFETLIGVPKTTKLRATGDLANKSLAPTALGLVPTGIPPLGSQFGEVKATPPMVTAIFRLPALGPLRFYVGGGASVLFVRDAKITNPVLTQVATPKLEVTPALGAVGQVGVDIHLFDRFSARLDIKELWFQPSQATISNIRVHTTIPLLETVDVGSAKSVLQANPIVVQAGIGASF